MAGRLPSSRRLDQRHAWATQDRAASAAIDLHGAGGIDVGRISARCQWRWCTTADQATKGAGYDWKILKLKELGILELAGDGDVFAVRRNRRLNDLPNSALDNIDDRIIEGDPTVVEEAPIRLCLRDRGTPQNAPHH